MGQTTNLFRSTPDGKYYAFQCYASKLGIDETDFWSIHRSIDLPKPYSVFENHLYFTNEDMMNHPEFGKVASPGVTDEMLSVESEKGATLIHHLTYDSTREMLSNHGFSSSRGAGRRLFYVDGNPKYIMKVDSEEGSYTVCRGFSPRVLVRQTSLFEPPSAIIGNLEPEKDVFVRSRVEYIIFRSLQKQREKGILKFEYEREIQLEGLSWIIKPDFTIWIGDQVYYWEHLGMLDQGRYYKNWQERKSAYDENELTEYLLTTDDLEGIHQEEISKVINDIISGHLKGSDCEFSAHHYQL